MAVERLLAVKAELQKLGTALCNVKNLFDLASGIIEGKDLGWVKLF
ncbi:hypothetical protein SDC9_102524 [bioreactor metagenome]|uniref:Uncharacterized protein n=1 Tax=bioreactor metagenome TaxID=1076179 RepID=A0A645ARP2_9ZZZZ